MRKLSRITKFAALVVAGTGLLALSAQAGLVNLGSDSGNKSTPAVATWLDGLVSTYNSSHTPDLPYPPGAELFRVNSGLTSPTIVGSPPTGYWTFGNNELVADLSLLVGKYDYVALHWGGSGGGTTYAYYIGDVTGPLLIDAPGRNGLSWYDGFNKTSPVPEPTTMIAGALLLLPFGASTLRMLRKKQVA